ncbi:f35f82bb-a9be-49ac-9662-b21cff21475a [Thermothielavioides terrestris]|uniref:F35f82bb-a9be-49ac-9662-b21cff21475a n=1 Tax=Thermothielavioides terrestris TaxID=2587410 RepID=A0A3S5CXM6_9PEZI|nr:f35f82bb-a9be-49ac-9662-b21cff21475a [Thermothielavioides terrestris]
MSTTTQIQTRTRENVLKDYELHHSPALSPRPNIGRSTEAVRPQATAPVNPPDWDTTHRRVPPFRPINRDRDQSEVRVYNNRAEQIFIGVMFTGVYLNSTAAQVWRATVGRWNDRIFKYGIGGEI